MWSLSIRELRSHFLSAALSQCRRTASPVKKPGKPLPNTSGMVWVKMEVEPCEKSTHWLAMFGTHHSFLEPKFESSLHPHQPSTDRLARSFIDWTCLLGNYGLWAANATSLIVFRYHLPLFFNQKNWYLNQIESDSQKQNCWCNLYCSRFLADVL